MLNNKAITADRLFLINPKKINNIYVSYPTPTTKQYQVDTKAIAFLVYEDLKTKANIKENQNPDVYVNGRLFANKGNLEIDKSFIKKIEYVNNSIRVTTKTSNKGLATLCRGVMTGKTSQIKFEN